VDIYTAAMDSEHSMKDSQTHSMVFDVDVAGEDMMTTDVCV
jgi:hypothetical protein